MRYLRLAVGDKYTMILLLLQVCSLWLFLPMQCLAGATASQYCAGDISTTEYESLQDLFVACDGSKWLWNSSESTSTHWTFPSSLNAPCADRWQGIQCNYTDYFDINGTSADLNCTIVSINLESYGLSGYLPGSVGNFTNLQYFDVGVNAIGSTIPTQFGSLSHLLKLNLDDNQFEQTIPAALGSLTNLQEFNASLNSLEGSLPSSFENLVSMIYFSVGANIDISGPIPPYIPQSWGSLQGLVLSNTGISQSIPTSLGLLVNLKDLDLSLTSMTGSIPSEIGQLTSMKYLNFSNIGLTGTIPSELASLTNLISIYLDWNSLSKSLSEQFSVGWRNSLQFLSMSNNLLTGTVQSELLGAPNLEIVNLYYNSLHGSLPFKIGSCSLLRYLDLGGNSFTQTLPSNFSGFKQLQYLFVDHNKLTGSIPHIALTGPNQAAATSLIQFSTANNAMTSTIPSELFTHTALTSLSLYGNHYSGTLASELSNLLSLQSLDVSANKLKGRLDDALRRSFPNMTILDLGSNDFTGSLPNISMPALTLLTLSSNCFSGAITDQYCAFTDLQYLLMDSLSSSTNCAAQVPKALQFFIKGKFPKKDMGSNMPGCLLQLPQLKTLELSGNGIYGAIPDVAISSSLSTLDLSFNAFTGTIPAPIQHFGEFSYLSLENNKLSGILLADFAVSPNNGTNQTELYLDVNRLSGNIPSTIHNLENLQILSGNLFGCNTLFGSGQQSLPPNDMDSKNYVCGSNQLDFVLFWWFVCVCAMGGVVAIVYIVLQSEAELAATRSMKASHVEMSLSMSMSMSRRNDSEDQTNGSKGASMSPSDHLMLAAIGPIKRGTSVSFGDPNQIKKTPNGFHLDAVTEDVGTHSMGRSFQHMRVNTTLWINDVYYDTKDWLMHDITKHNLNDTTQFWNALLKLSKGTAVITSFYLLVMLGYAILKSQFGNLYSTTTQQYTWLYTAAFLHGYLPPIFLLFVVFLGAALTILSLRIKDLLSEANVNSMHREKWRMTRKYSKYSRIGMLIAGSRDFILFPLVAHLINGIVVLLANCLYVATVLTVPATAVFFVQLSLSIFKTIWVNLYIPFAVEKLQYMSAKSHFRQLVSMLLVNYIIGPGVATTLFNSDCFYEVFTGATAQTASFSDAFTTCDASITIQFTNELSSTSRITCALGTTSIQDATSHPPFLYSYQCGSSFLVDYIPVLLYSYLLSAFVFPVARLVMLHCSQGALRHYMGEWLYKVTITRTIWDIEGCINEYLNASRAGDNKEESKEPPHPVLTSSARKTFSSRISSVVSGISSTVTGLTNVTDSSDAFSTTADKNRGQPLFDGSFAVAKRLLDVAVLMTFGLACPMLAITIALSTVVQCVTWKLMIGKYLSKVGKDNVLAFTRLERAFRDGLLRGAIGGLGISILAISAFWSIMFYDMVADQNGDKAGFEFMLVTVLSVPILCYAIFKLQGWWWTRKAAVDSKSSSVDLLWEAANPLGSPQSPSKEENSTFSL
jgi:Leucine-rich repeat (LRR) protein